jgi:hypothetical protein
MGAPASVPSRGVVRTLATQMHGPETSSQGLSAAAGIGDNRPSTAKSSARVFVAVQSSVGIRTRGGRRWKEVTSIGSGPAADNHAPARKFDESRSSVSRLHLSSSQGLGSAAAQTACQARARSSMQTSAVYSHSTRTRTLGGISHRVGACKWHAGVPSVPRS